MADGPKTCLMTKTSENSLFTAFNFSRNFDDLKNVDFIKR